MKNFHIGDALSFPTILLANLSPIYPMKDSPAHFVSQLSIADGSECVLVFLIIRKHSQSTPLEKRHFTQRQLFRWFTVKLPPNLGKTEHLSYWFIPPMILFSAPLTVKKWVYVPQPNALLINLQLEVNSWCSRKA